MNDNPPRILIVDDDANSLSVLEALVRREGFEVITAADLATGVARAADSSPAAILVDYYLPDGAGLEILHSLSEPKPEVVLITGQGTLETAVEALRSGASDYLTKPVDAARLKTMLEGVARRSSFKREIHALRHELRDLGRFGSMVGASPAMQELYDLLAKVAPSEATVLVTGESGTGKELVAETVHRLSRRAHRPLVAINCGAVSATLIESELFGHERGSFTGADRQRKGVFERAHQGTLFLDEISEMPVELQVKLLRVLETGSFTRVGGEKAVVTDVRVIAASNRDLEVAVEKGTFRNDLLYRLRVFPVELPPLRERGGDVELLAEHFLTALNRENQTSKSLSRRALDGLEVQRFPGNVRELRNAVHQAYILADEVVELEHLPVAMRTGPPKEKARIESARNSEGGRQVTVEVPCSLAEAERRVLVATLEELGGDKTKAAEALGISLKTLYSRLREYAAREPDA